jgi:hypothetical protein
VETTEWITSHNESRLGFYSKLTHDYERGNLLLDTETSCQLR